MNLTACLVGKPERARERFIEREQEREREGGREDGRKRERDARERLELDSIIDVS